MKYPAPRLRRALGLALATAFPLVAAPLHAALIAYDNFDTYVPGALDGLDGGVIVNSSTQSIGWTGPWTAAPGATVSHEQVKYDHGSIRLGEGQSLKLAANSNELLKRMVPVSSGTSTYYVSFVFKIVGRSGSTDLTGPIPTTATIFSGWQAVDGAPSYNNDTIGFIGREAKAGARVGEPTSASPDSFVSTVLQYGQAYFCVIKYSRSPTTNATFNSCQVWINPATGSQTSTNSATKAPNSASLGSTQFAGILARTVNLSANSYQLIDDLRIGTAWEDVTGTPPDSAHTIDEKLGWKLYNPAPGSSNPDGHTMDIYSGGALDQSALVDHSPAGTHGRLVVRNGRFEFLNRSGTPTRFAGVNFNFDANMPDLAQAGVIAATIRRSGYNVVRLHHFDDLLADSDPDDDTTFKLNTTNMQKLNRLTAQLRARGIYYNIDLFSTRKFSTKEVNAFGVPNLNPANFSANKFKALIPINPAAFESWKKYARLLLNTAGENGVRWKNDPALVGICPVNEDDLYKHWDSDDAIAALYNARFNQLYPNTPSAERPSKFSRFLYETHKASDTAIRNYLRNHTDVQTQVLLTGTNYGGPQLPLVYQRSDYDYVDEHSYFNHPSYGSAGTSALPHTNSDIDSLVRLRAQMPRDVMASRVFGKPFTITEWNACRPNRYRAEAAFVMPAYASLQDWDGLYCFQYAGSQDEALNGGLTGSFALASDPIGLITSRITALLFLRRDIKASTKKISWAVRTADNEAYAITSGLSRGVSSSFLNIGLVSQVGMKAGTLGGVLGTSGITAVVTSESPAPTLIANSYTATDDTPGPSLTTKLKNGGHIASSSISGSGTTVVCNSDTGEITLNAGQGLGTLRTNRSEVFALAPGATVSSSTKNVLQIKNGSTPATVCVIAIDSSGQSLGQTNRILVAHLTDVLPRGMKFADSDRTSLTAWGSGPFLIAGGDTDITLKLAPGTWTAHVLDQTGKPVGRTIEVTPVPNTTTNFSMKLSTVTDAGTQMLYELVRG